MLFLFSHVISVDATFKSSRMMPMPPTATFTPSVYQLSGEYKYIGRIKSHSARITGLEFGYRESSEVLISVSEDRWVRRGVRKHKDHAY